MTNEKNNYVNTINYINAIHGKDNSYVFVCNTNPSWQQKSFLTSELTNENNLNNNYNCYDCYISMNNFKYPRRTNNAVKELTSFYVDLDIYKKNLTKEQVLFFLEEDYFEVEIPTPTFIIDSGRGLYLIWNIENIDISLRSKWKEIQKIIAEKLVDFGADFNCLDEARIFRLPGTINSKNGKRTSIIDTYKYTYTLEEFQIFYEDILSKKEKKREEKKKKNINNKKEFKNKNICTFVHRERSLYLSRLADLETLIELRQEEEFEGSRELILFLYRYWYAKYTNNLAEAKNRMLSLNKKIKNSFREEKIIIDTDSVDRAIKDKKEYKYTNERLIKLLQITKEEEEKLITIISRREYLKRNNIKCKERNKQKRRNKNGLTKREQKKQELINKIHKLKNKGLKNIKIAEILNITQGTVSKYLKLEYKELEYKTNKEETQISFSFPFFCFEKTFPETYGLYCKKESVPFIETG